MIARPGPHTLIAELTYRCPLRCGYCSNPVDAGARPDRLDADAWARVVREAAALGVLQVHLTGGEPLVREDLEPIVAAARDAELYVNLITSGLPLTRGRLAELARRGLDAVQLSLQSLRPDRAARVAGRDALAQKLEVARWVTALGLPLTLNVVLHRDNIDEIADFVALARALGAVRLELANVQLLGWALANRPALLPSREALEQARQAVARARAAGGPPEIAFVIPDYFTDRPRACMGGWAAQYLVVSPEGLVLPCQAAHTITGLRFDDVRTRPLAQIWESSPALARFRGEAWMPEPCRGCDRRDQDFGGCRCQAFHLAGDAAVTDPACARAPAHAVVEAAREEANGAAPLRPVKLRTLAS
jgi:pyrroloquinoline quinone biosynthesis protein E